MNKMNSPVWLTVLLIAGSAIDSNAQPSHTGARGRAAIYLPSGAFPGPVDPAEQEIIPVRTTIAFVGAETGRAFHQIETDVNGFFEARLHPGRYVLVPETFLLPAEPDWIERLTATPIQITVEKKQYVTLVIPYFFSYDRVSR